MEAANSTKTTNLPDVCEKVDNAIKRLDELDRKLGVVQNLNHNHGMILELFGRIDTNLGRIHALIREN